MKRALADMFVNYASADEILDCVIQMKATEQYFTVVLFILLYKMMLRFESVVEILCDLQMKAIEQYFSSVFLIQFVISQGHLFQFSPGLVKIAVGTHEGIRPRDFPWD